MITTETVLYTAKTHTTGGRDGASRSDDGRLDIQHASPGSKRPGTNPEQLFAAGWSACFLGALQLAAAGKKVRLPADAAIDAEVDLKKGEGGYSLGARLHVKLPGLDQGLANALAELAHETCPYSKATRGTIDVTIDVTV